MPRAGPAGDTSLLRGDSYNLHMNDFNKALTTAEQYPINEQELVGRRGVRHVQWATLR